MELLAITVPSQDLLVRESSGELRVAAPRLHFLTGKSFERLHDGVAVPFDFQLTLAAGSKNNLVERALERFTVSYDVWEEKFSVVRLRDLRKSGPHLSANMAESWCLENIFVAATSTLAGQPLWARLEVRSAAGKEPAPELPDAGLNLAALIEVFSRPPRQQQDHWALESAQFHLADLKP